jgi:hypothetical protein
MHTTRHGPRSKPFKVELEAASKVLAITETAAASTFWLHFNALPSLTASKSTFSLVKWQKPCSPPCSSFALNVQVGNLPALHVKIRPKQ